MTAIIIYNRDGSINRQYSAAGKTIPQDHGGQLTRITIHDGRQYIGYLWTDDHPNQLILDRFDCDQQQPTAYYNFTNILIPFSLIKAAELILYSNPRWGVGPSKDFTLPFPRRNSDRELHQDYFSNWPSKSQADDNNHLNRY